MKKLKIAFILVFFLILAIPLIFFNTKADVISEIDNRKLADNPFSADFENPDGIGKFTAIKNYFDDRIGFRDDIINIYTIANDKIFGEMIHPSYEYGKDGYIFFKLWRESDYEEYHKEFAKMIKEIQTYCEERGVPFLFVMEPSKSIVLEKYLPNGVNYRISWKKEFLSNLDAMGVKYVDNTDVLIEKAKEGEVVFNQKYNAGHWNDLGAFYGVNAALQNLKNQGVNVELNTKEEFTVENKLNTSLPVSKFPIHETEPIFSHNKPLINKESDFDELELNEQHSYFQYTVNNHDSVAATPKTLVFQGSYMNGMGYKFLENRLKEYISIHDYQNVLNFDYYFNIFKPECVIFEAADYTLADKYFEFKKMKSFDLNPKLDTFSSFKENTVSLSKSDISYDSGKMLTTINVKNIDENAKYVYLNINNEIFDMRKADDVNYWSATLLNSKIDKNSISIITIDEKNKTKTKYLLK